MAIEVRSADINEFELIVVMDSLQKEGVKHATIRKGNGCVWVARGPVNEYYRFSGGRLVDIQVD